MGYPTTPHYVDRAGLARLIDAALTKIAARQNRFVLTEFYGLAGVGKTRVLRRIEQICPEQGLRPVWIRFPERAARSFEASLTYAMIDLVAAFSHEIERAEPLILLTSLAEHHAANRPITLPTRHEAERLLQHLCSALEQNVGSTPLVLLIDCSENCHDEALEWLGYHLMLPLYHSERVPPFGVFIAGHGERLADIKWHRLLDRSRQSIRIAPFDPPLTQQYVDHLVSGSNSPTAFYDLSQGHPYSIGALVYWAHELGIQNPGTKRSELAQKLYDEVINQYILRQASADVIRLLKVACVPRQFAPTLLQRLLAEMSALGLLPQSRSWHVNEIDDQIEALLNPPLSVVVVGNSEPAYALEPTLRNLLHTALVARGQDDGLLEALHKSMLAHCRDALGSRNLPASVPLLALGLIYHTVQLATFKHGDPLLEAQEALDELLRLYFDPDGRTYEVHTLRRLVSRDQELAQLLGADGQKSLVLTIQSYLQSRIAGYDTYQFTNLRAVMIPPAQFEITWDSSRDAIVPSELMDMPRQFSVENWRTKTQATGSAAFRMCLPKSVTTRLKRHPRWALQITTNLAHIPWELLHDGTDYLCISRPFGRRPHMQVPGQWESLPPLPEQPLRALVVGSDPDGNLPGVKAEVFAVKEALLEMGYDVDLLWGKASSTHPGVVGPATAEEFSLRLCNEAYHLVHYAGHAMYSETDPARSRLKFSDSPFFATEFEDAFLGPSFVFFNACETAMAQTTMDKHGAIIEGLAISVLLGGAKACLGPMWTINDTAAKAFALAFYRQIKKGVLIGEAVRIARLQTKALGTDTWASWVLYGNPLQEF